MRHVLEPFDLTVSEIDKLLRLAQDIKVSRANYSEKCKGKILATLFYEPSTRTRLSFESAMLRLGGSVLGFSSADASSAAKGESVADTISMVSRYADIAAIRHPKEGAPMVASLHSLIPIINAGDGGHQHPTQTLTDLFTIFCCKGRLDNLTLGLCGDLLFGRTVHSLIHALSRYKGIKFILISPEELKVPAYIISLLKAKNIPYEEVSDLNTAIADLDILYMTRIQKERFADLDQYDRLKNSYILDKAKMSHAKADCIVLHPLPRVNEISVEVDKDPRAYYFEQAGNGVFIRMALILSLLEIDEKMAEAQKGHEDVILAPPCKNPRCITSIEQELPPIFKIHDGGKNRSCIYCEQVLGENEKKLD